MTSLEILTPDVSGRLNVLELRAWPVLPTGVVSLFEMLAESAEYFVTVGRMFEGLMFGIRGATTPNEVLRPVDFEDAISQWSKLESECSRMGMDLTADSALQAIEHFRKFRSQITYALVMSRAGELYRVFIGELRKQKFFRLAPERARYFVAGDSESPAFGMSVESSFPDAAYDVREASRCLATERDTACVLHLMRVLEIGLQRLAQRFNVPFERGSWNKIIDLLEAQIRAISTTQPKAANWKSEEERYARVAKEFRYIKDSWRNHAMHARSRYDFEEAQSIFKHTRELMTELATII